jgi:hypothetical protein
VAQLERAALAAAVAAEVLPEELSRQELAVLAGHMVAVAVAAEVADVTQATAKLVALAV